MIGIDTTTLVAYEIENHPLNPSVTKGIKTCIAQGGTFAIAPQVINEFLHVVTDAKRFSDPLTMLEALERIKFWQKSKEILMVFPSKNSLLLQEKWMREYRLGRKRVLDTALAATYKEHGIRTLATANPADFAIFGVFTFEDWAQ